MCKKVLNFIIQGIATAMIYALIIWLFNAIFDKEYGFTWSMTAQSLMFSILFTPLSIFLNNRKTQA